MKGESGYTLVETMIAMLLVAMVVTSVFSMVVTAKTAATKSGAQAKAHFYARQQMEKLKSYVSADLSASGPTTNWVFPNDTSGVYALRAGNHDVSANLPSSLRTLGWSMSYTVTNVSCGTMVCNNINDPACCKKVEVFVSWPGP